MTMEMRGEIEKAIRRFVFEIVDECVRVMPLEVPELITRQELNNKVEVLVVAYGKTQDETLDKLF